MKWAKNEELEFIKGVASGKTFDELATSHNRTSSALELRLKKIIYDNVSKGRGVSKLAKGLNLDKNKVIQYYYSYAEFREKNGKGITNADINGDKSEKVHDDVEKVHDDVEKGRNKSEKAHDKAHNKSEKAHDDVEKGRNKSEKAHDKAHNKSEKGHTKSEKAHDEAEKRSSQNKTDKIRKRMNTLEEQNKLLEIVIKNSRIKKYINRLNKDGKLDSYTKKMIKKIVK
jgi:hypothetical protein